MPGIRWGVGVRGSEGCVMWAVEMMHTLLLCVCVRACVHVCACVCMCVHVCACILSGRVTQQVKGTHGRPEA